MVQEFNDIEAFFDSEAKAQEAAALRIPSWAGTIKAGDYFVREAIVYGEPLTIWGEVLPATIDDEEGNEIPSTYEGSAYRFSRCFSAMCDQGELGDVHLSTVTRLVTKEEFEAARAKSWR